MPEVVTAPPLMYVVPPVLVVIDDSAVEPPTSRVNVVSPVVFAVKL